MEDLDPTNSVPHPDVTDDSHLNPPHDHTATVEDPTADGTAPDDTTVATDDGQHSAPGDHLPDIADDHTSVDPHEAADSIWGDIEQSGIASVHDAVAEVLHGEDGGPEHSIWGDIEQSGMASVRDAVADAVHGAETVESGPTPAEAEQSGIASVHDGAENAVQGAETVESGPTPAEAEQSGIASVHDGAENAVQGAEPVESGPTPADAEQSGIASVHDGAKNAVQGADDSAPVTAEQSDIASVHDGAETTHPADGADGHPTAADNGDPHPVSVESSDGHSLASETDQAATVSDHDSPADAVPAVNGGDGLDAMNHDFKIEPFPGLEQFNGIHGTPVEDMKFWEQQSEPMDCAVATTDMIFRSLGIEVGEVPLEHLFQDAGIYDPAQGTDIRLIADLLNQVTAQAGLNLHAVEVSHFTEQNLEQMLDAGVRPLIGLNASEIYDPMNRMLNALGVIPNAGHAVQLTGIIHDEHGTYAVINDPGVPNGSGTVLPMDLFMDAASKMDYEAVAIIPT